MDEPAAKENPATDFNKLDLSQLQSFSFGTQWTQDKSDPAGRASPRGRREDRPHREGDDRRPDSRDGVALHRDRRAFRKPAGTAAPSAAPAGGEAPASANRPPRRDPRDARDPRDSRGGPGGPRQFSPRGAPEAPRPPYDSPFFNVAFYPEDTSFAALAKTIRASCRTLELFDIARTILAKNDRFVAVVQRKPAATTEAATPTAKPAPLYLSVLDGLPFETDAAVIAHVLSKHLDKFFDLAEVEIEPPKGNFQVINRCTITGELLSPPNYHRYSQIIQQHHAAKVARMPFEQFRERIESVRDPELINQWLEKMKRATRYTWKAGSPAAAKPAAPVVESSKSQVPGDKNSGGETPAAQPSVEPVAAEPAAPASEATAAVPTPAVTFDSFEEARTYLLTHASDKVFRALDPIRFPGKLLETIAPGEIRRAVEGHLERQRRFPLDTANGLRGRLRRESFTIFKKGSKGISYVCAVKRRFRVPGQVFADSIGTLIAFIEAHPMVRASELPEKFLGLGPIATLQASSGETSTGEIPAIPAPALTPEQRGKLVRLQGDLRWLVTEGYVTEFIDGRLFAAPPIAEAKKKEAEASENDPENFPEAAPEEAASSEPAAAETNGQSLSPVSEPAAVVAEEPPVEEPKPETPAS
ncbi:MAG TPA: hypothetical protein VNV15_04725 [Opitutaceae bacterium]|jgi:hypothetical protein|nr:hypothetical protein [Opitutaceae bacterium]